MPVALLSPRKSLVPNRVQLKKNNRLCGCHYGSSPFVVHGLGASENILLITLKNKVGVIFQSAVVVISQPLYRLITPTFIQIVFPG